MGSIENGFQTREDELLTKECQHSWCHRGRNNEFISNLRKSQPRFKNKVMQVDETDRMVWGLITDVPKVSKPVAIISGILNLVIPGAGTLVAACAAHDNVSKT